MALQVNSATSSAGANITSLSYSHTASGTNRLVVTSVSIVIVTPSTMTYGGTSETLIGTANTSPAPPYQNCYALLYRLINPPTGAQTVSITAGSVTDIESGTISFTGADQSSPIRGYATSSTNSVNISSAVGDIVVDCFQGVASGANGALGTPGSGQTQQHQLVASVYDIGGGSTKAGAASVTMSWTNSTVTTWALIACSVIPAVATGSLTLTAATAFTPTRPGSSFGRSHTASATAAMSQVSSFGFFRSLTLTALSSFSPTRLRWLGRSLSLPGTAVFTPTRPGSTFLRSFTASTLASMVQEQGSQFFRALTVSATAGMTMLRGLLLGRSLQLPLTVDFCRSLKHKLSTQWTSQEDPKKACWKEDN